MSLDNFVEGNKSTFNLFDNVPSEPQPPVQPEPVQGERVKKTQPKKAVPVNNPAPSPVNNMLTIQNNNTADNLALLVRKPDYTDQEWDQRINIYVHECERIKFKPDMIPSDIRAIASQLDALLTSVRFDDMFSQKKATDYETILKTKKELYFQLVKEQAQNAHVPIDGIKSLVIKKIDDDRTFENGLNLFEVCRKYQARCIETKSIISVLRDKQDMLIHNEAAMKIEVTATSASPTVPTQSQFNQMRG